MYKISFYIVVWILENLLRNELLNHSSEVEPGTPEDKANKKGPLVT